MFDRSETQQRINEARRKWGNVFDSVRNARESWNSAWYAVENKQSWIDEEESRLQGIEKEVQRARKELAYRASIQIPRQAPVETPND